MTVKEIAEKYRTSSRNVYRKIERGIKRMKAIVEEVGIEYLIKVLDCLYNCKYSFFHDRFLVFMSEPSSCEGEH
jgi:predicted DNA-binding protein YlxM (UPF0122 family)